MFKKKAKVKYKVCREARDLNGLENGLGLKLVCRSFLEEDGVVELLEVLANKNPVYWIPFGDIDNEELGNLRCMGFKFEWEKSQEEVLSQYEEKAFVHGKNNYLIIKTEQGRYQSSHSTNNTIGTRYYSMKDTFSICEELNKYITGGWNV